MARSDAVDLSTVTVAAATGYSVQQIRDLEAHGVIGAAPRKRNGYRVFSARHIRDLHAYRDLAVAVGPVEARRVMREIRVVAPADAPAQVASLHVELAHERDRALQARRALLLIRTEAEIEVEPTENDTMTITELAEALGVRTSTLRFWEKEQLVTPQRVATNAGSARRYPLAAIREARIVVALRAAGYRIPDVRRALTDLRDLRDIDVSLKALDSRIDDIAARTLALLRAGAVLAEVIACR
ncbi:MerR family transcriptional regulator [Rhodococcus sp. F64268]|uniref:MerR family transcriptional regulator n=1 Tax=Rhodococcus sp. F64268 TaxID=2926402 RepID=UPI001FF24416|nr:MerR family transcriptional regulator [Rhodococcus sp. F64268]MCK0090242.1 MerR family transcriptional regulator [Rhodococcus sp. F64268]